MAINLPNIANANPMGAEAAESLAQAMDVAGAQEAILQMMEAEEAQTSEAEEQPTESEESQPLEEESVDESEADDSEESYEEEAEESTEEEAEGEEGEETYTVKVNGEDVEVTYDELISGYSRTSDYTRKTQEIAEQRKQMESVADQLRSGLQQLNVERQQYQQALGHLGLQISSGMQKFKDVDWNRLKLDDPVEFAVKREEFREEQERLQKINMQINQVQVQMQEDQKREHAEKVDIANQELRELIPEWSDDQKRVKLASEIRDYGVGAGYTEEEITSLADSRAINILMKAMRYDALQKADVKGKKLKNKPKLVKPGSKRAKVDADRRRQAELRNQLKSSGSVDDAAALMEDFF